MPRHPLVTGRFAWNGLRSAVSLANARLQGRSGPGHLFAGMAAHSMLPLERRVSAAFGLVLGASGHAVGWPMPRGGAQRISDALASHLVSLGGRIETGVTVRRIEELPQTRVALLDVTPKQVVEMAGGQLPGSYRRKLEGISLRTCGLQDGLGVERADTLEGVGVWARRDGAHRGNSD